jgi:hypothetical protein
MDGNRKKCEAGPSATKAVPFEAKRMVQVGAKVDPNFVPTASDLDLATESPAKKKELVPLCHERVLAELELLMSEIVLPSLETTTIIPSFMPTCFFFAIVSVLLPMSTKEPSLFLARAFSSVSDLPTKIGLPKEPFKSD